MSLIAGISPRATCTLVEIGDRSFRIWHWTETQSTIRGVVTPDPLHEVEKEPRYGMDIETSASFKITQSLREEVPTFLVVQNISVALSRQRQGWGSDMVRALIKAYPHGMWEVSGPNEQSGPMFNKLSEAYPDRVKPTSEWLL